MSVVLSFDGMVNTLTSVTPECEVLIAAGRALAWEIDTAAMDNEDSTVKPRSAAAAVTALRALVADLLAKGSASGSADGEADGEGDWTAPSAVPDLAEVRHAKESGKGNARARGRRGGSAAG